MELTPQALHDVEFREARRGGYNTRDVDDFLERVAIGVGQLQDRLREAYHRAEAAEGRLAEMQRQLDEMQRRGPSVSPDPAGDADETLRRTLVLAQRTADATIKEAKDEANRLLAEARDEVAQARANAESEAQRDARAELEQLTSSRDALMSDIETLERHVDDQRNRIRDGLSELQKLVDDPSVLRTEAIPRIADVPPPSAPSSLPSSLPSRSDRSDRGDRGDRPDRSERPEPAMPSGNGALSSSSNGGYASSPFAGLDFSKTIGNGAPVDEQPAAASASVFDPPAFDPPSFDPPPAFDPPAYDSPSFTSSPPPPSVSPSDGSMVNSLQELHGGPSDLPPRPARESMPPGIELPGREPLPSRGDVGSGRDGLPPGLDVPGREPVPSREAMLRDQAPIDAGPSRDPLPMRGDQGPGMLPGRDPLPSRGDGLPGREPLPARGALPPTEPVAVPGPGQPGSTGFLPDLNAVFNPPGSAPDAPRDDLPLPIDAPPPPPPPGGFDHLQDMNGIPIEPGSRPSEWGRGVFDPDDEYTSGDQHQAPRFGRRG